MSELWRNSVVVAAFLTAAYGLLRTVLFEKRLTQHKADLDQQLERAKGDIRRDVERDLKYQESRLRVAAEMELKMHEREWQALEEATRAFTAAHQVLQRGVVALAGAMKQGRSVREWMQSTPELRVPLVELGGAVARVPGEFYERYAALLQHLLEVRDAVSAVIEKMVTNTTPAVDMWLSDQFSRLDAAEREALAVQREWRTQLGQANSRILQELETGAPSKGS